MKFVNAKEFIGNHAGSIAKGCVIGALVIIADACGVQLNVEPDKSEKYEYGYRNPSYTYSCRKSFDSIDEDNPQERAILALLNSSRGMAWDSDGLKIAKKIRDIAEESGDDDICATAITALEDLSTRMTWESSKTKISDYIYEITTYC